jgi:flagellar biogenesis protein FliO
MAIWGADANPKSMFNDPNYFNNSPSIITGELIFKIIGSLCIIAGLCFAIRIVSKKAFPGLNKITGKGIVIHETAVLGPRKYLHIVEVSNQRLLLGSTNDRITMLAHLIDDLSAIDIEESLEDEAL